MDASPGKCIMRLALQYLFQIRNGPSFRSTIWDVICPYSINIAGLNGLDSLAFLVGSIISKSFS